MPSPSVTLIVYTTLYRKGGEKFPRVAATLADEQKEKGYTGEVICSAVESKRDLRAILHELITAGKKIDAFHFVGHSGMYGPMFGTVKFPEQFSPYEWETLELPFAKNGAAYFHCCRSARWFAPFFARTFNVKAYGFFWYTTFSTSREYYRRERGSDTNGKLYTIGCKGKKSHGWVAAARKRAGLMPAEVLKQFDPPANKVVHNGDDTYNEVAALYDAVFADIKVRTDEWRWLLKHLPENKNIRVLDIGCGNGALLQELAPRITEGIGVDESGPMLEKARERNAARPHLSFVQVDSPALPFPDQHFDLVISLLSFRYLDWDPLMSEIKRVTRPGGTLLIIDMVTVPVKVSEYPAFLRDKLRAVAQRNSNKTYRQNLSRLVSDPHWKTMLQYNPIRSEHEMKWYLESRFPGRKMEIINYGWNARTVAFDAGPVESGIEVTLTYP